MLISWNNSEWKGVADIQLEGNLLWYPDIVLYNKYVNNIIKLKLSFFTITFIPVTSLGNHNKNFLISPLRRYFLASLFLFL